MLPVIYLVITLLCYSVNGLAVSIHVIPDTVGQDATMTLTIRSDVSIPRYGGFLISVPSQFKSTSNGHIECTVNGPVTLQGCDTLSAKEVQVTLASNMAAGTEFSLDISTF